LNALIETHYLPSIAYFAAVHSANSITLEKHENYTKQTYRNRCHIVSSQGKEKLIVPLTSKHGKVLITDVRIDYDQKWLNNHWRGIRSAYGKAPFFEYYQDDLEKVLFRKPQFLYDLNLDLLSMCLKWLKFGMTIKESESYVKTPSLDVLDLRSALNPKNEENLQHFFQPATYHQVFGNTFVKNASIIDLIFCEGPEAARIVQMSTIGK
jgi:hypothetical protein